MGDKYRLNGAMKVYQLVSRKHLIDKDLVRAIFTGPRAAPYLRLVKEGSDIYYGWAQCMGRFIHGLTGEDGRVVVQVSDLEDRDLDSLTAQEITRLLNASENGSKGNMAAGKLKSGLGDRGRIAVKIFLTNIDMMYPQIDPGMDPKLDLTPIIETQEESEEQKYAAHKEYLIGQIGYYERQLTSGSASLKMLDDHMQVIGTVISSPDKTTALSRLSVNMNLPVEDIAETKIMIVLSDLVFLKNKDNYKKRINAAISSAKAQLVKDRESLVEVEENLKRLKPVEIEQPLLWDRVAKEKLLK